jgi:hypothetical protein
MLAVLFLPYLLRSKEKAGSWSPSTALGQLIRFEKVRNKSKLLERTVA